MRSYNNFAQWHVGSRYRCESILGEGAFGEVALARDLRENGSLVAIKKMKKIFQEIYEGDSKKAFREIHLLRQLHHPCIVRLNGAFCSGYPSPQLVRRTPEDISQSIPRITDLKKVDDLYLAFEYVETDLKKIIEKNMPISIENIKGMIHQILAGLLYAHSARVIHRDLKPANILIDTRESSATGLFKAKVADFGLSRVGQDHLFSEVSPQAGGIRASFDGPNTDDSSDESDPSVFGRMMQVEKEKNLATGSSSLIKVPPTEPQLLKDNKQEENGTVTIQYDEDETNDSSAASAIDEFGGGFPNPEMNEASFVPMKRLMSNHVASRHYRAPEIILRQSYGSPIDVWSVGCIFAELLAVQAGNHPFPPGKTLFPGGSCGDFSPVPNSFGGRKSVNPDQLAVIMTLLGRDRCQDMRGFTAGAAEDMRAAGYIRGVGAINFSERFRSTPPEGIDLLLKMLTFNPNSRITVEDALKHPFLASQRNLEMETTSATPLDAVSVDEYEAPEHILQNVIRELNYHFN